MHFSLPSMGCVVHVCFQLSSLRQSHGKKLWLNLGFLKCNQDLNNALDIFAKKKIEKCQQIHQISLEMI
jgi:hypothetical protein